MRFAVPILGALVGCSTGTSSAIADGAADGVSVDVRSLDTAVLPEVGEPDAGDSDVTCGPPQAGICSSPCRPGDAWLVDRDNHCETPQFAIVCYPAKNLCVTASECAVRAATSEIYVSPCSGRLTSEYGFRSCTDAEVDTAYDALSKRCP